MDSIELTALMAEEDIQNELRKLNREELYKVCTILKVGTHSAAPHGALVDAIMTTDDPHALMGALESIGFDVQPIICITRRK